MSHTFISKHLKVVRIDPMRPLRFSNITCLCSLCDAKRGENEVEARSLIDAIADQDFPFWLRGEDEEGDA